MYNIEDAMLHSEGAEYGAVAIRLGFNRLQ